MHTRNPVIYIRLCRAPLAGLLGLERGWRWTHVSVQRRFAAAASRHYWCLHGTTTAWCAPWSNAQLMPALAMCAHPETARMPCGLFAHRSVLLLQSMISTYKAQQNCTTHVVLSRHSNTHEEASFCYMQHIRARHSRRAGPSRGTSSIACITTKHPAAGPIVTQQQRWNTGGPSIPWASRHHTSCRKHHPALHVALLHTGHHHPFGGTA